MRLAPVSSSDKNDIYMIYIYKFTYAFISACTELHILIQVITFCLKKMACVLWVSRLGLSRNAVPWKNGCSPLKGRRIKAHGLKDAILNMMIMGRDLVYGGITIHLDHLTVMLVKFAK